MCKFKFRLSQIGQPIYTKLGDFKAPTQTPSTFVLDVQYNASFLIAS